MAHAKNSRISVLDSGRAEQERRTLARSLLDGYIRRIVNLSELPPTWTNHVSPAPRASHIAAYQAPSVQEVTSGRHNYVHLDDLARRVITLADGTRSPEQMVAELVQHAQENAIVLRRADGSQAQTAEEMHAILQEAVPQSLHFLALQALLVG